MRSTDHNINNPLKTIDIDTFRTINSWNSFKFISITQEEYDLMQIHEPYTLYHIKDSKDNRYYVGDMLIENEIKKVKYLLSIDDNKLYTIYMNQVDTYNNSELIPICSYEDPQVAINKLSEFNRVGSHFDKPLMIYNILINYIEKIISTHEFIIGILDIFGYKEDPRLQDVIQFIVGHNEHKWQKEFLPFLSNEISRMRDLYPDSLYPYYSNLYDLIVKYNFFTDKKYNETDVNLSKEIDEIIKIMNVNKFKFSEY